MAYEVARASVGIWTLTIDDITPPNSDGRVLQLSIEGNDFDLSVNISCLGSLESIAKSIESCGRGDITAGERCFARWTVADLFVFADESKLTFLLLDTVGEHKRFRISVPVVQKSDFLTALSKLKAEAETDL